MLVDMMKGLRRTLIVPAGFAVYGLVASHGLLLSSEPGRARLDFLVGAIGTWGALGFFLATSAGDSVRWPVKPVSRIASTSMLLSEPPGGGTEYREAHYRLVLGADNARDRHTLGSTSFV